MIRHVLPSPPKADKKRRGLPNDEADGTHQNTTVPGENDGSTAITTDDNGQNTIGKKNNVDDDKFGRKANETWLRFHYRLAWDRNYYKLAMYVVKNKIWPGRSDDESKSLNRWLYTQREGYRKGKLAADKKRRLEDLGFFWEGTFGGVLCCSQGLQVLSDDGSTDGNKDNCEGDDPESTAVVDRYQRLETMTWYHRYSALVIYLDKNKIWPHRDDTESRSLSGWLYSQRLRYRNGMILPAERTQLEDLGFCWEGTFGGVPFRPGRSESISESSIDGSNNNSNRCNDNNNNNDTIERSASQIWARHKHRNKWDGSFTEVVAYLKRNKVWPHRNDPESTILNSWLCRQRKVYNKGKLSAGEVNRLEDLGFCWEGPLSGLPFCPRRSESLSTGGIDGSSGSNDDNNDNIVERNSAIRWDQLNHRRKWDCSYAKLVVYLEKNKVWPDKVGPQSKTHNGWLRRQRKAYRGNTLPAQDKKRLDDLGFAWVGHFGAMPYRPRPSWSHRDGCPGDSHDNGQGDHHKSKPSLDVYNQSKRLAWRRKFSELVAYLEKRKVWPNKGDPESKTLNWWLVGQRVMCRKGKLSPDEIQLLDDLGFPLEGHFATKPYRPRGSRAQKDGCPGDSENNDGDADSKQTAVFNYRDTQHEKAWSSKYSELITYLEKHKVWPKHSDRESCALYRWLSQQRYCCRKGRMAVHEKKKLDDLGFSWQGAFAGSPWCLGGPQMANSTMAKQGSSVRSGQDAQDSVDDEMERSDDHNDNDNDNDNDDENNRVYFDGEDIIQDEDEEEGSRNELNETTHDYDSQSSCCSDIIYNHSDDDDDDDEDDDDEDGEGEEDEYADSNSNQELHNIQQDPSRPIVPVVTSSCGEASNGGEPSEHNQDTVVADTMESSVLPLEQSTIHTAVARLPGGDGEDHQVSLVVSPVESVSLCVSNQRVQLRRVSEKKSQQFAEAGFPRTSLSGVTTMYIGGDRQVDVDEGDRKMAATDVDGILGDEWDDEKPAIANSPAPVEHVVQQEPDGCGSSSPPGSRKRRGMDPPESHVSKRLMKM